MTPKVSTLLTLDAFGTLFTPREPIAKLYGDTARKYGLTGFSNDDVGASFRKAFRQESAKNPNYGKEVELRATEWWNKVITATFRSLTPSTLPDGLVSDLLHRFSSSEGYMLYPDVQPLLQALRTHKERTSETAGILVGILTNSDDRVPSILASLGLQVSPWRYGTEGASVHLEPKIHYDIDFVALSYDIGYEKPHSGVFNATLEMVNASGYDITRCVHAGDDLRKDYQGAEAAGWTGLLLDREDLFAQEKTNRIRSLAEIQRFIGVSEKSS